MKAGIRCVLVSLIAGWFPVMLEVPALAAEPLLPDLVVLEVDDSSLAGDWQTLQVTGEVMARISNEGQEDVIIPFNIVFFEDLDGSGSFDHGMDRWLGAASLPDLAAGEEAIASAEITGELLYRNSPVHAFADSEDVVTEADETNNYGSSGDSCFFEADIEDFEMQLFQHDTAKCNNTPVIIDLDLDGYPEIITIRWVGDWDNGRLRVLKRNEVTGLFEEWYEAEEKVCCPATPAAGDIDLDGYPEILVANHKLSGELYCYEHDGTRKTSGSWGAPPTLSDLGYDPAVNLADLDQDGMPEIIVSRSVLNNDGSLRWVGDGGAALNGDRRGSCTVVADLDNDPGDLEVICGKSVYKDDPTLPPGATNPAAWTAPAGVKDGFNAVADFDFDGVPEVVLVSQGDLYVFANDMTVKWGPMDIPTATSSRPAGPPTVAFFNDDDVPDIGVAAQRAYITITPNPSDPTGLRELWRSEEVVDTSSGVTGSTVFDFNGDGSAEVIYRDHNFLYIFNGLNGETVDKAPVNSLTQLEYPLVVDVDKDGEAEIVVSGNENGSGNTGIRIFESVPGKSWSPARPLWNQHAYCITNINDDGTIPFGAGYMNNWDNPEYNNFRQNVSTEKEDYFVPDLTASYLRFHCGGNPAFIEARIGNGGALEVEAGAPVSFYSGDPRSDGVLLGTVLTAVPLPPGHYEDVLFEAPGWFECTGWVYASADDAGGLTGAIEECDEENNLHGAEIPEPEVIYFSPRSPLTLHGDGHHFAVDDRDLAGVDLLAGECRFVFAGQPYFLSTLDGADIVEYGMPGEGSDPWLLFSVRHSVQLQQNDGSHFFARHQDVVLLDPQTGTFTQVFDGVRFEAPGIDAVCVLEDGRIGISPDRDWYCREGCWPPVFFRDEDLAAFDPETQTITASLFGAGIGIHSLDGADYHDGRFYLSVRGPQYVDQLGSPVYLTDGDVAVYDLQSGLVSLLLLGYPWQIHTEIDALSFGVDPGYGLLAKPLWTPRKAMKAAVSK